MPLGMAAHPSSRCVPLSSRQPYVRQLRHLELTRQVNHRSPRKVVEVPRGCILSRRLTGHQSSSQKHLARGPARACELSAITGFLDFCETRRPSTTEHPRHIFSSLGPKVASRGFAAMIMNGWIEPVPTGDFRARAKSDVAATLG